MMPLQTSRMDLLKAQALTMRLQTDGVAPMQESHYAGIQLSNQPEQSMLNPKYIR